MDYQFDAHVRAWGLFNARLMHSLPVRLDTIDDVQRCARILTRFLFHRANEIGVANGAAAAKRDISAELEQIKRNAVAAWVRANT